VLAGLAWCVPACGSASSAAPHDAGEPAPSPSPPPSTSDGGADGPAPTASRCQTTATTISCTRSALPVSIPPDTRKLFYEVPLGSPPAAGWPVVFFFQGSFAPADHAFGASSTDAFGLFHLAATVRELLDHGYAVVAPDALQDGTTAWQTNIPPWSQAWSMSADDAFMRAIYDQIAQGALGTLDQGRFFAMGISSGGFMTSRMAVSYAGMFRALAVHSASYATCSAVCTVPTPLPTDHPPTFFLHGGADTVVPPRSMQVYRDALAAEGHVVDTVLDPNAGHEWLAAAPSAIRAWFDAHP
jgi:poly(3-hydroxybutyrate) depolymerase